MLNRPFFVVIIVGFIVGCAGHGGGSTLPATKPSPSAQSTTAPLGAAPATASFATIASGASGSVGLPATTSGSATATLTLQSTVPTGVATPSAIVRKTPHTASLGGTVTSLVYVTLSISANVTIGQTPSFSFTFPSGALAGTGYIAFYDPGHPTQGWQQIAGPVAATGTSIAFPATSLSSATTLTANTTYIFALVTTATTLPVPTPADCPTNYTPVAGGVPLNITDDSGLSGAQLVVYVFNAGTSTFLSTDGTDDSGVPVPFPAACYSTTTGSAGTQQLLVPTGATGGRIYFAYAPYTAGSATIPNPFAGGSSSGPPGVGGGMLVGYPWDFIEYGTAVSGTTDDTSQVDALGLPIQLSIGATPLPALTPGAQPTPPPAGTTPVPCPTAAGSNYVGVSSCNFANIFYAMENSQNISNNVLTGAFPSSGGSTIDLRVISPGESAGITAYPWNVFAQASTIVSPTPTFCPSSTPYGYLSCLLASYQQTGRVFTSVVPGAGPVKVGATPGPDFVTGDYYCVTSDGETNFTFTDIGTTQTTTCPTPDPSASPSAAPSVFHMNVYNLMYGVPPLNDNAQQTTCKPAILLQQPWGLANVDNTVEATAAGNAGGHIFANDDAFAVWKGMIADIVYGTAYSTTQVHPVGAVTPPPPSVALLFKDPMYDHYDYILHQYFDNGLTYGLAYDDLYGLESGVLWNPGDPIDVRINAIPTASSAITPPNPSANPSPCPVLTPGIGTAY